MDTQLIEILTQAQFPLVPWNFSQLDDGQKARLSAAICLIPNTNIVELSYGGSTGILHIKSGAQPDGEIDYLPTDKIHAKIFYFLSEQDIDIVYHSEANFTDRFGRDNYVFIPHFIFP